MRKYLILFFALVAATFIGIAQTKNDTKDTTVPKTDETTDVVLKWYKMDEVLELTAKAPKKILIDVYTDWCGWCKVMDKQTFADPKIAAYLNKYFYAVKFNAEEKTPVSFGGKTYNFIPEYRSNELAIALLQGKMSYPNIVYMDEKGQLLSAVPGFQKPEAILPILVFFGEGYYNTVNWEDFAKDVWPAKQKEMEK